MGIATKS